MRHGIGITGGELDPGLKLVWLLAIDSSSMGDFVERAEIVGFLLEIRVLGSQGDIPQGPDQG